MKQFQSHLYLIFEGEGCYEVIFKGNNSFSKDIFLRF